MRGPRWRWSPRHRGAAEPAPRIVIRSDRDRDLAAALIEARTVTDVARVAVERAAALYGASLARVAVRDERDVFNYVGDNGPEFLRREHASFSLHGLDPSAVVMRTDRAAFWRSFTEF